MAFCKQNAVRFCEPITCINKKRRADALLLLLVRVKGLEQLHKHRVKCSIIPCSLFAVLRSIFCKQNMRVKNRRLYQTKRKGIRIAYPFSFGAGKRT